MMNNYSGENLQDKLNGYGGADGMGMAQMADVVEKFLAPGVTFHEALVRSGMDWLDALDFASIFDKGLTFNRPEMMRLALSALIAHAGDQRFARREALAAVTRTPIMDNMNVPRTSRWKRLGKKSSASVDGVGDETDGNAAS